MRGACPRRFLRAIACGMTLVAIGCQFGPETPPLLRQLQRRSGGFDLFVERATRDAEIFRRTLLVSDHANVTPARRLGEAMVEFQKQSEPHLAGRRSTARFALDASEIERAIIGTKEPLSAVTAYGPFAGKWYGLWDGNEVDHHWSDVTALDPPKAIRVPVRQPHVYANAHQYAWIGDGYGLNLVAEADLGGGRRRFLLGYVVHVKDKDPDQVTARRPHVGVLTAPGQLIWITAKEVFLEESFTAEDGTDAYAITGFHYELGAGGSVRAQRAFQAVYSRQGESRLPFHQFTVDIRVPASAPVGE